MTTDSAGIFDEDVLKALRSAIDCADDLSPELRSEYFHQLAHCHRTIADMLAARAAALDGKVQ